MTFKGFILFLDLVAILFSEVDHLCNFGKVHYGSVSCESVTNFRLFGYWFKTGRRLLRDWLVTVMWLNLFYVVTLVEQMSCLFWGGFFCAPWYKHLWWNDVRIGWLSKLFVEAGTSNLRRSICSCCDLLATSQQSIADETMITPNLISSQTPITQWSATDRLLGGD